MSLRADDPEPLHGLKLAVAGFAVAVTNFAVILDLTITNVAVPHIAGGLAVSPQQGTWTITSYAVAEAICVPLSGWLSTRFGLVRSYTLALLGFGIFSLLCGLSQSLDMLIVARVMQGFCGGPLMPMSQSIMMRIFPRDKQAMALGLWGITTVSAPIFGPIFGGIISDNWSWHWVFLINVPVVAVSLLVIQQLLPPFETTRVKLPIDKIGLMLLVLWVGAYQVMLDTGQTNDWFQSTSTIVLAIIAVLGLVAFVIWELTDDNPIVDLGIFRYRGFSIVCGCYALAYMSFMAAVVLAPLWLQKDLGYSATTAGYAMAFMGVCAVLAAPLVARLSKTVDLRLTVSFGIFWMSMIGLMRTDWAIESGFWTLSMPQLLQGIGIPFYFIGINALALGAVPAGKLVSAAGMLSFIRTLSGATGTTLSVSQWEIESRVSRSEIASSLNATPDIVSTFNSAGLTSEQIRALIDRLVDVQANTLSVNHMFLFGFVMTFVAAACIWLVPRPKHIIDLSAVH